MRPTVRVALIFAACYIAFRLAIFSQNLQHDENWSIIVIFANMLFILLAVFFGLRAQRKIDRGTETIFLHDFKNVLQSGVVYALVIGIFTFAYYSWIDKEYLAQLIERGMQGQDGFDVAKMGEGYPQGFTNEEIIEKELAANQLLYSPSLISALTTLALFLLGTFYTIFLVILQRKVLSKLD